MSLKVLSSSPVSARSECVCLRGFAALLVPLLLCLAVFAKDSVKSLSPHYREWLTKDVAYIISDEEKQAFLHLAGDPDRENFIERFWEIRNPTPGAPTNPYRLEHYERLQYASDHFSSTGKGDGWNSDMGRVYITLGPPNQKARYVTQSGVRGMEIWFYRNTHPALPPFFNVLFYEKDFGEFRLYSPYMDGPQKLVTGIQAEQGRVQAVQQVDRILGREVALTTLSLIPGEPVSMNDAQSTIRSDMMLGTIRDLANHPFTLEDLRLKRALNEGVTHRIVLANENLNIVTVPLRDAQGNMRLHYVLRLAQPEDFAVAQTDERFYYSLEAQVKVVGADGKEIYTRERKIAHYLTKDDLETVKGKPVAYDGWLPLAPGKYKLDFVFTNVLTKTAYTTQRDVVIPEVAAQDFFVTDPIPFSQAAEVPAAQANVLPFTVGGVRFQPYVGRELALAPGQDLKFFYQVWRPSSGGQGASTDKLLTDYAYGRPSFSGSAKVLHEELPKNQFDAFGSVVNGKKIDTTDLAPGNYRLTVTISDPGNQEKRFSALRFNIVTEDPSGSDSWWIDDDGLSEYLSSGQSDFDRGLAYLAGGQEPMAVGFFQEALHKNAHNERARARLIDYYFRQREFAKVVSIFAQTAVTAQTEEITILSVADSLDRTGDPKTAVNLLQSALSVKPPSGPLYLALSSYYQHLGDNSKAESFHQKGQSLLAQPPSSNQ